jgi:hypothetical protein
MNNDDYVLSVENNDLVVYKKHNNQSIRYICKNCIDAKTKRTKRLCYAIKTKLDMSFKLTYISNPGIDMMDMIEISVQHPLYDDDRYILTDESLINDQLNHDEQIDVFAPNQENQKPLSYIYILELEQNKYYIGKTTKPMSRTGEHLIASIHDELAGTGLRGAGWTGMYPPIKVIRIMVSYDEFDEDLYTLRYMKEKGIDNVRGGSFCELNLNNDNVLTLGKMLAGAEDRCYFCGADDHYINDCPQRKVRRTVGKKKKQSVIKQKDVQKSRILKFYGAQQLMNNSSIEIEDKNKITDEGEHACKYCGKVLETKQKLMYHEKLVCKQSDMVQKSKKIDADVDAILEANKKYIK